MPKRFLQVVCPNKLLATNDLILNEINRTSLHASVGFRDWASIPVRKVNQLPPTLHYKTVPFSSSVFAELSKHVLHMWETHDCANKKNFSCISAKIFNISFKWPKREFSFDVRLGSSFSALQVHCMTNTTFRASKDGQSLNQSHLPFSSIQVKRRARAVEMWFHYKATSIKVCGVRWQEENFSSHAIAPCLPERASPRRWSRKSWCRRTYRRGSAPPPRPARTPCWRPRRSSTVLQDTRRNITYKTSSTPC